MAVPLEHATLSQLKDITGIGDRKAQTIIKTRIERNKLTHAMMEEILGREMSTEEKAGFPEWEGTEAESESEEEEAGKPSDRPRGLKFDGTHSWRVFRRKFERFNARLGWNSSQAYDFLEWAMEGNAAEYFVLMAEAQGNLNWKEMLDILEKRYGMSEGEEVAVNKLQTAQQERRWKGGWNESRP